MSRTYDRDTKHYHRAVIDHLVETGEATYFEAADVYVIKSDEGTFAVRSHQIIDIETCTVIRPVDSRPAGSGKRSWVSESEEDEILKHFGI